MSIPKGVGSWGFLIYIFDLLRETSPGLADCQRHSWIMRLGGFDAKGSVRNAEDELPEIP